MTSSAFAIVAESPAPAISTRSRPARACVSGSGLPAAVPAPRDYPRVCRGCRGRDGGIRNSAQAAEFTDRRVVLIAFWAQHARPQKLRPTPIGARIQAESGQGSDVTEIICLVTVTCDGNGAAAAARPAMIPHGACGSSSDRVRPASPGRHTAPATAVTPGELPPMDRATSPVPGPGRVASRGRLRRQRVRATPPRRLLPRASEGKSR
jgi:hypothetical protein